MVLINVNNWTKKYSPFFVCSLLALYWICPQHNFSLSLTLDRYWWIRLTVEWKNNNKIPFALSSPAVREAVRQPYCWEPGQLAAARKLPCLCPSEASKYSTAWTGRPFEVASKNNKSEKKFKNTFSESRLPPSECMVWRQMIAISVSFVTLTNVKHLLIFYKIKNETNIISNRSMFICLLVLWLLPK